MNEWTEPEDRLTAFEDLDAAMTRGLLGEGGHVGAFGEVLAEEAAGVITPTCSSRLASGSTALYGSDRGQLQHRPDSPPADRSATLRKEQPGTAHP